MRTIIFALTFVLLFSSTTFAASKEGLVKKGNAFFKKEKYDLAIQQYQAALSKDSESPTINFNAGVAYYKIKDYDRAISHLSRGLLSDDVNLKKNVHYNLGNALYAKARQLEEKNLSEAHAYAQKAKEQFESALKMDDKDKDALYNYEVAKRKEEEIAKKLPKKNSPFGKQGEESQDPQSKKPDEKANPNEKEDEKSKNVKENDDAKKKFENENSIVQDKSLASNENKNTEQKPEQGFSQDQDMEKKDQPEKDNEALPTQLKPGEMTKEEAKSLLKQYEQSNESPGLLNFDKHKASEATVLKDW